MSARLRVTAGDAAVLLIDGQPVPDDGAAAASHALMGAVLSPPLVDLSCEGSPADGFAHRLPRRAAPARGVGFLTEGGEGKAIAAQGLARDAGARILSDGDAALGDDDVALGALRWAAALGLPVMVRPATPALERGVWRAGAVAVQHGWAPVHPEGEALGVHRWATLAAVARARVHLTPLWSAAGVLAFRQRQGEGWLSAGTSALHAFVPPSEGWRAWPVLGDDDDRAALVEALSDGTLLTLCTGGRPLERTPAPLALQPPTGPSAPVALGLSVARLGPARARALWSDGPRGLLGLSTALDPAAGVVALGPAAPVSCPATGLHTSGGLVGAWGVVSTPPGR